MAKQSGIHQIRGKVGGMSYYRMKDVQNGLVRKINEGMSERVKSDAAFQNTRLNAAEFGAAGGYAGACVRAISLRWRTILNPFATGHLLKPVLDGIKSDISKEWGKRNLTSSPMPLILESLNQQAKNSYTESFAVPTIKVTQEGSGLTFKWAYALNIEEDTSINLKAKGAEGVMYDFYCYASYFGTYSDAAGSYQKSRSSMVKFASEEFEIGESFETTGSSLTPFPSAKNIAGGLQALLCVAKPYKVISNEKYILQELCSFILVNETEE